jgi:uncharacterized protein (TIGR03437 family)
VTIAGTNWTAGTRFYFDSLPGTVAALDLLNGSAIVTPPPGAAGQQATIVAYTPDGQNSQFIPTTPVIWPYGNLPTPQITSVSPASLPAGAEAMIEIAGSGTSFTQGLTRVGFGTSDIVVRNVFVLSRDRLQVNVSVAPGAALSNPDVSVFSGFEFASAPSAFQISAAVPRLPTPFPTLVNGYADAGVTGLYPGAIVSLYGRNLALADLTMPTITIGGQPVTLYFWSSFQINLQIPVGLPPGPAVMKLNNGQLDAYALTIYIDPEPAGFSAVQNLAGDYIGTSVPAHQGDVLVASMNNFASRGTDTIALERVRISLGGIGHPALQITAAGDFWQVTFQVGDNDPVGTAETLIVYLDGAYSAPVRIAVAHPDGSFTADLSTGKH